jgi:MFS family permease
MIFVGMMFGGYIWGSISDRIGRRNCLIYALALNGMAGICSSFVPNFIWLLIFRFLAGLGTTILYLIYNFFIYSLLLLLYIFIDFSLLIFILVLFLFIYFARSS